MAEAILDHGMGSTRTTCHPKRIGTQPQPYPDDAPAACKKGTCGHSWEARIRLLDGSQPKRAFDDKHAAIRYLTAEYNKKAQGEGRATKPKTVDGRAPKSPLVEDYVTAYIAGKRDANEKTKDKYLKALAKHAFPHIGKVPLKSLKQAHILKLVTFLESEDKKRGKTRVYAGTIRMVVNDLLRPAFSKAIKAGLMQDQPVEDIHIQPGPDADRYLPEAGEVHAIASTIRPFFRAAIYLMAGCGLREGEALAFTSDCIRGDRIYVYRQWRGKYGFGNLKYDRAGKGRWIPLDPIVKAELERHIEEYKIEDGEPLFYSSHDSTRRKPIGPDSLEHALRMALATLGLLAKRIRPHNFRHFFASFCVARGIEIAEVSKMLGHKNIQTTYATYYQLPKNLDAIMLAINGFLSDQIPPTLTLVGAHKIAKADNAAQINDLVAQLKALSGMNVILEPYALAA